MTVSAGKASSQAQANSTSPIRAITPIVAMGCKLCTKHIAPDCDKQECAASSCFRFNQAASSAGSSLISLVVPSSKCWQPWLHHRLRISIHDQRHYSGCQHLDLRQVRQAAVLIHSLCRSSIASCMLDMHAAGWTHLDIKPNNVAWESETGHSWQHCQA